MRPYLQHRHPTLPVQTARRGQQACLRKRSSVSFAGHLQIDFVIRVGSRKRTLLNFNQTRTALEKFDLVSLQQQNKIIRTHDDFAERLPLPGKNADPRLAALANENLMACWKLGERLRGYVIVRQGRSPGVSFKQDDLKRP